MNKIKFVLIIILFVVTSLLLICIKPQMHKQVVIDDADFAFVEEEFSQNDSFVQPAVNTETSKQIIKIDTAGPSAKTVTVNAVTPSGQKKVQNGTKNNDKPATVSTTAQNNNKQTPVAKTTATPKVKKDEQKKLASTNGAKTAVSKPAVPKTQVQTNNEKKSEQSPLKTQLTEEEEIIVWNKWRSDLQNQVMKDTKIAAPLGTGFKFSFTVDKFGKISNLKVWSTSPAYSELAVKVIKPILLSYQGQPILNFPEGTKRVITNVTGGFRMATHTGYSSPDDYSDIERIKKLR